MSEEFQLFCPDCGCEQFTVTTKTITCTKCGAEVDQKATKEEAQ